MFNQKLLFVQSLQYVILHFSHVTDLFTLEQAEQDV